MIENEIFNTYNKTSIAPSPAAVLWPTVKIRKVNHRSINAPELSFSALKIKAVGSLVQTRAVRVRSGTHG